MRFSIGSRVMVVSKDFYEGHRDDCGNFFPRGSNIALTRRMSSLCGNIVTIADKYEPLEVYEIKDDLRSFLWTEQMFETHEIK